MPYVISDDLHIKVHPTTKHALTTTATRQGISLAKLINGILDRFVDTDPVAKQALEEFEAVENFKREYYKNKKKIQEGLVGTDLQKPEIASVAVSAQIDQAEPPRSMPPAKEPEMSPAELRVAWLNVNCEPKSWHGTVLDLRWNCEMGFLSDKVMEEQIAKMSPEDQQKHQFSLFADVPGGIMMDSIDKLAERGLPPWYAAYAKIHPEDIPDAAWGELGIPAPGAGGGAGRLAPDAAALAPPEQGVPAQGAKDSLAARVRALVIKEEDSV